MTRSSIVAGGLGRGSAGSAPVSGSALASSAQAASAVDSSAEPQLIRAMAEGDTDALARLYDLYAAVLLGLAQRILRSRTDSEDLVHDVFLEVWQQAHTYDPARGSVRRWLIMRLRSRALDRLKSVGHARSVSLQTGGIDEARLPHIAEPSTELGGLAMQHAVLALPVADQQLLELAYFQGRSLSEVASALAIPLGTVKSRLRRLLLKLRRVMDVLQDREPR